MASTKNIIVGAANFFVGGAGDMFTAALPATAAAAATAGFASVGFTQEGVEVAYEPNYGEVEVDQLLDPAQIFKQGMRVTVNTTLAEATLENLLIIWGQDETIGATREVNIRAGALGEAPVERSLLFVGPAPVGGTEGSPTEQERVYRIYRAIQTGSSSFALRRSEATGLPASFRCLPHASASGGASYGTVTDRAVTTLLSEIA